MKIDEEIMQFLKNSLNNRLEKLTTAQKEKFKLVWPEKSLKSIDNYRSAIDLCDRTLKKSLVN